jgi:hypothetical protein
LVTLGIGGNDIGFSSVITKCVGTGTLFKLAVLSHRISSGCSALTRTEQIR